MGILSATDKWLGRASSIWTFASPIVPGTIGGIVIGYLAKGVGIISQFGAFGWVSCGLAAGVAIALTFALSARAQLWRVNAQNRARLSEGSSPFDPMQRIFQNKRIRVIDLVNPYDQVVIDKKFLNCEIIGPANIFIAFDGKFIGNNLDHSDAVEISKNVIPQNAIAFSKCDFEDCRFFKVTMLFQEGVKEGADRLISNLHWITKAEPLAIEDCSDEPESE